MEFVINWVLPFLIGLIGCWGAFWLGTLWERGHHKDEPCSRRHADELR